MKAEEKYDWWFRGVIANLPVTPEFVREDFKHKWIQFCNNLDRETEDKIHKLNNQKYSLVYGTLGNAILIKDAEKIIRDEKNNDKDKKITSNT